MLFSFCSDIFVLVANLVVNKSVDLVYSTLKASLIPRFQDSEILRLGTLLWN